MATETVLEFGLPYVQASVMGVDCTGSYVFLTSARQAVMVNLDFPCDFESLTPTRGPEPTCLKWHPSDPSRIAVIRKNTCEILSWSANESRISPLTTLRGFIRPISSIDWCPSQPNLLATSSSEQFRAICIWDLRDPSRPVKNTESLSATSLIRWNPLQENKFVTGHTFLLQFWDIRHDSAEKHFSTQPSRILDFDWSPRRATEFCLSTEDNHVRILDTEDLVNPVLTANYKRVPMIQCRYTPQGTGIVSRPARQHWCDAGLLLWRADTLSPMRFVPKLESNSPFESASISEESCVLGFGWCLSSNTSCSTSQQSFSTTGTALQFDSKECAKTASCQSKNCLITWSLDRKLCIHALPAAFINTAAEDKRAGVDDSKGLSSSKTCVSGTLTPIDVVISSPSTTSLVPTTPFAASVPDGGLPVKPIDTSLARSIPAESTAARTAALPPTKPLFGRLAPQRQTKNLDAASRVLAQEISLLSPSAGQYKLEEVDYINRRVKLTLFYCRLAHYHHVSVCHLVNDHEVKLDLETLFQTDTPFPMPSSPQQGVSGEPSRRTSGDTAGDQCPIVIPRNGQVTLIAEFPPAYPSPNCPPVFRIVISHPCLHPAVQIHVTNVIQRTAHENVAASRGCMEPCIRKAIRLLNTSDFSSCSVTENLQQVAIRHTDLQIQVALKDIFSSVPCLGLSPSRDAGIPFPRTSGARFSPSGFLVAFGLHRPLSELFSTPATPAGLTKLHTPCSYQEYRGLLEGKRRHFRINTATNLDDSTSTPRLPDRSPGRNQIVKSALVTNRQRIQMVPHVTSAVDVISAQDGEKTMPSPCRGYLLRSRSLDAMSHLQLGSEGNLEVLTDELPLGSAPLTHTLRTESSISLRSLDVGTRFLSGKGASEALADNEVDSPTLRKVSATSQQQQTASCNRRITFATAEQYIFSAAHQRKSRLSTSVNQELSMPASTNRPAFDNRNLIGATTRASPKVLIYDISVLIPISKELAVDYSLDISDPAAMCMHNLNVATKFSRTDLIQFWSYCASLANGHLRQAPLPGMIPPWAVQSMGRPLFYTWRSHFLKVRDIQSLAMLGLVMAALDTQATPPALVLTLAHPQPAQDVRPAHHQTHLQYPVPLQCPVRSRSTVLVPNRALLELREPLHASANIEASVVMDIHVVPPNLNAELALQRQLSSSRQVPILNLMDSGCGHQVPLIEQDDSAYNQSTAMLSPSDSFKRTRSSSYSDPIVNPIWSEGSPKPSQGLHHISTTATSDPDTALARPLAPGLTSSSEEETPQVFEENEGGCGGVMKFLMKDQELFSSESAFSLTEQTSTVVGNYSEHCWLLSSRHLLQFTHIVGAYIDQLGAWGMIMRRTRLSMQWHKVLQWMEARNCPDFYQFAAFNAFQNVTNALIVAPSDWSHHKEPESVASLINLQLQVLGSSVIYPPVLGATIGPATGAHINLVKSSCFEEETAENITGAPDVSIQQLLECIVCRMLARGLVALCPSCHHGGHVEHISEWFAHCEAVQQPPACPSPDCDCICVSTSSVPLPQKPMHGPQSVKHLRVHRDSV